MGHGVPTVGNEVLVHGTESHRRPVAADVEDVDPAGEQTRHDQAALVGRVAEVVKLVTRVGHVDAVHDLAEVGLSRIGADHGDEVWVALALGDGADVQIPLVPILTVRCNGLRDGGDERCRNQHAGGDRQPGDRGSSAHGFVPPDVSPPPLHVRAELADQFS